MNDSIVTRRNYIEFTTTLHMHEENSPYWIDGTMVDPVQVNYSDLNAYTWTTANIEAFNRYCDILQEEYDITVSKTARKHREPLYNGHLEEVGFVVVGSTLFPDPDRIKAPVKKYIDICIRAERIYIESRPVTSI